MNIIEPDKWYNEISNHLQSTHQLPNECRLGTLVDVGANVGGYIRAFGHLFDKIVGIEACTDNFKLLESNIKKLPFNDRVELLHNAAYSVSNDKVKLIFHNDKGSLDYYGNSGNPSLSTYHREGWGWDETKGFEEVISLSIEDIAAKYKEIKLIKIDIEGGENDFVLDKDLSAFEFIDIEFHFDNDSIVTPYLLKTHNRINNFLFKRK